MTLRDFDVGVITRVEKDITLSSTYKINVQSQGFSEESSMDFFINADQLNKLLCSFGLKDKKELHGCKVITKRILNPHMVDSWWYHRMILPPGGDVQLCAFDKDGNQIPLEFKDFH